MTFFDKILMGRYKQSFFPLWAIGSSKTLFKESNRSLADDKTVVWDINRESPKSSDHIEMSGFFTSAIISYGKDSNNCLKIRKHITVPTVRMIPNLTSSSFNVNFDASPDKITIDGEKMKEIPFKVSIRGNLSIESHFGNKSVMQRTFTPSVNYPALIEKVAVKNISDNEISVNVSQNQIVKTFPKRLFEVGYVKAKASVCFNGDTFSSDSTQQNKCFKLKKNENAEFYNIYFTEREDSVFTMPVKKETDARNEFTDKMFSSPLLKTGNAELDAQFSHCVLRGSESIFKTKNGLMHGPGGGGYYAALWTNDQCEYANPFFPFSGYAVGIEQSLNCYTLYKAYMDMSDTPMKDKRALVTSIISCGDGFWNGAKDRGDGAMYAYGASRFLLSLGDKALMEKYFEALKWCVDFSLSRKNENGVIASDSDELENRFESGDANLCTSCLVYDALGNCAIIAGVLGLDDLKSLWNDERKKLRDSIESFFGREVEGFNTYRYYEQNTNLRSWICMPLTVEIFDRTDETIKALFSDKLYVNGMLKSTSDNKTTWDRSLLYALRGVLLSGEAQKGADALLDYCKNRLLGCHSPYPFEAYPEGNRAHLAAESILFCRAVTEGLFGLKPVGFCQLRIKPSLSSKLNDISLQSLNQFGKKFDLYCSPKEIKIVLGDKSYISNESTAVFDFNKLEFVR